MRRKTAERLEAIFADLCEDKGLDLGECEVVPGPTTYTCSSGQPGAPRQGAVEQYIQQQEADT